MVYNTRGTIRYKDDGWVIVECPTTVVNYYKFWVEKFLGKKISTSYHDAHITVVSGKYEKGLQHKHAWKKYDGQTVKFRYSNEIRTDNEWFTRGKYFWLPVECKTLQKVRVELGLKPEPYHQYHLTIGYCGY